MGLVNKQFLVDRRGRKRGIVLSIKRYRQLMEDLHDLAIVAERREEKTRDFAEVKRRLKEDGIV
ncbi:hypothetical protein MGLY_09510 [Neomoorella glycerini]|uniref:Prevent-host-death protein n=1 Tax=Neomoorella glycerini TaxID=55779 RepID=A0A6I5ZQ06_9FIRM|nr:hypothetical protein [Moorella glycerini]QGP91611.1 hypothetical protein MGLY_09510 [Moorella glycerini]